MRFTAVLACSPIVSLVLVSCTEPTFVTPRPDGQRSGSNESSAMGTVQRDGGETSARSKRDATTKERADLVDAGDESETREGEETMPGAPGDAGDDAQSAGGGAGGAGGMDGGRDTGGGGGPADVPTVDSDDGVPGTWTGDVEDPIGRRSAVCMIVTQVSEPGPAGSMTYEGTYSCRANIEYIEPRGGGEWFVQEVLTPMNRGCPTGNLLLELNRDGTLDFQWFLLGQGEVADEVGTMTRVSACP
jgi:hypothetical protein